MAAGWFTILGSRAAPESSGLRSFDVHSSPFAHLACLHEPSCQQSDKLTNAAVKVSPRISLSRLSFRRGSNRSIAVKWFDPSLVPLFHQSESTPLGSASYHFTFVENISQHLISAPPSMIFSRSSALSASANATAERLDER